MNTDAQEMKDLLLILCKELVEHPDELHVDVQEQGALISLQITCADSDMGKLIGRRGRRAQAIRTLLKAKAIVLGRRVLVDFAN